MRKSEKNPLSAGMTWRDGGGFTTPPGEDDTTTNSHQEIDLSVVSTSHHHQQSPGDRPVCGSVEGIQEEKRDRVRSQEEHLPRGPAKLREPMFKWPDSPEWG